MLSVGGLAGANMIAEQLEIYRWGDHFRRMREQGGLSAQNDALRNELARLGAAYNELARNFKHFANAALQMETQTGERIAQLESEVSELRGARTKAEAELQEYVRESIRRDFEGV